MYLRLFSLIVISCLSVSCANMDQADCLNADWQLIGFEDGSFGKNQSHISQHRQECAEYAVTPDLKAYQQGHLSGSKIFCTSNNGFSRGWQGKDYNRNCPEQFEDAFLVGFTDGQTLYGLKKVHHQHTLALEQAYKELTSLEQIISEKSELMIADGFNRDERLVIRDEIARHQQRYEELITVLPELKQMVEETQRAYEESKELFSHYLLIN